MNVDDIMKHFAWPLVALIVVLLFVIMFRKQLKDLLSRSSRIVFKSGKREFQIDFGELLKQAKERAQGIGEEVAASGATTETDKAVDFGKQTARDIVLEAWGALKQIVYNACIASQIPLTPATGISVAVGRLEDAKAIGSETASVIVSLHELAQRLANDTEAKPSEEHARGYREVADVVVDWMMLNIIAPKKAEPSKPEEVQKAHERRTVVGEYFPQPQPGHPAALLVGIGGKVRGQRYPIDKRHFRIGSSSDNDLWVKDDQYVSGNHASLSHVKGSLLLSDQGSRNGTFLNDKRVTGTALVVRRGDLIRFGESVFQVADASGES
jgi:hypothetical protein